jgi:quercetin dioxygenase-like cupin family protein
MEFERIDPTTGDVPADLAEHFQGEARIQRLPTPFEDGPAVFAVHFQPGSRTRPHVHPSGQVLQITSGEGVVGGVDGRRLVQAGDVVVAMPGEWHWHGATPFSPMTHLTVQSAGPDSIDWDVEERDWAADCDG